MEWGGWEGEGKPGMKQEKERMGGIPQRCEWGSMRR